MQRIYLDYAATTPVAPEVEAAMRPYFLNKFGNAGSLHFFGQEAIAALDESRETIANAIGAKFREIIFTGSATEANNLALRGAVRRFTIYDSRFKNKKFINHKSKFLNPRIIISAIEHESVLETARDLEKEGVEIIIVPVSRKGIVDLKKLKESLNEQTILVSVMYANNEIGVIQPITEIARIIKEFSSANNESIANKRIRKFEKDSLFVDRYPLLHTDAVQAFQFLDCNVEELGVDLMTLSAHKIYGPKGIGALYVRQQIANSKEQIAKNKLSSYLQLAISHSLLAPLTMGGGQEFGVRSGTENIPLIVGFAKAVSLVEKLRASESKRISTLRDYFWRELKKIYPKARTNADYAPTHPYYAKTDSKKFQRKSAYSPRKLATLPNFLNINFPDYEAADLLVRLDLAGVAVSAGSACSARSAEPSYIMDALGLSEKQKGRNIRITLGRPTSKKDIDAALKIIRKLL